MTTTIEIRKGERKDVFEADSFDAKFKEPTMSAFLSPLNAPALEDFRFVSRGKIYHIDVDRVKKWYIEVNEGSVYKVIVEVAV